MVIEDLQRHPSLIPTIARWHFDQWGPLTGAATLEGYIGLLEGAAAAPGVPSVLVALVDGGPVGSVSLVASDMRIRPLLTPWLAQLFVVPGSRQRGIGAALVSAAVARGRALGYRRVYLYTSGSLPSYYERLGWVVGERVEYEGRERTLMHRDTGD